MPADWWPDQIQMTGSVAGGPSGKLEVSAVVTADNRAWRANALDDIRASLWMAKEMWRLGLVKNALDRR
jgi:hypothetical protein